MGAKGGYAPKDAAITDNFNQKKKGGLTKRELDALLREARMEKVRLESEKKRTDATIAKLGEENIALREQVGLQEDEKPPDTLGALGLHDAEDEKSAYKMLQDLRYAYSQAKGKDGKKGRQRLLELMQTDSEFKYMVKELMKIEVSLMNSKIKSKESGGDGEDKTVFVVLKGLEEEKKFVEQFDTGEDTADLNQISHALNPDGSEYRDDVFD